MITETFPNEVKETYFIPPIKKKDSVTNKSIPSREKLITMWRNRQHKIKILDKKINEENQQFTDSAVTEENDIINELCEESVQWLKYNQAPWELVLEHWNKCYTIRVKDLKQFEEKNLATIFDKWQLFKHPQGYELIALDFENMNVSKINLNYDTWFNFFTIVKQNTNINHKNNNLNVMVQQIEDKEMNEDAKAAIICQLLSHFLPPRKVSVCGKNSYKASIGAAKDSMIKHANVPGDMLRLRFETKKHAETLKIPVQPYIITVGDYKTAIESYVCVDETLYKVNTTIEAIDICFKAFHVFQLQYPGASEHLWILMQRGIYGFSTKWDPNISFIAHILKKLQDRTKMLQEQIALNNSIESIK
ncbi:uncharacterized protein [Temnothorax nylanderi]|uniref:uncharacterized protein n=1 Tax=Temnothorax nylanderi TaxID=102681 RepID=UPI003A840152